MGYYITQKQSNFKIVAANIPFAHKALTEFSKSVRNWSWANMNDIRESQNLTDAMSASRWDIYTDKETGDIYDIDFVGQKAGDESEPLRAIAKYVEKGSYIQFEGEDGEMWRHYFDGEVCKTIYPEISWPDMAEDSE
jgi:hypothetical protein